MEWHPIESRWNELRSAVREKWSRLTEADVEHIAGCRDELCSQLRRHYGYAEAQAQNAIDDFLESIVAVGAGGFYVPEHP